MGKALAALLFLLLIFTATACGGKAELSGSGTEAHPYLIGTADDLWTMAALVNTEETRTEYTGAHYRMTADIDLGGKKQWDPIDGCGLGFDGVFDGSLGYAHQEEGLILTLNIPDCVNTGKLDGNRDGIQLNTGDLCGGSNLP